MAHHPDPLAVPGQHAAAHLVFLKGLDFAAEQRRDARERNVHGPLAALAPQLQRALDEVRDEVRAGDVQVGEVRAVGLVHVDVALVQGGAGKRRDGAEEVRGGGVVAPVAQEVVVEGVVEAALGCGVSICSMRVKKGGNVHATLMANS